MSDRRIQIVTPCEVCGLFDVEQGPARNGRHLAPKPGSRYAWIECSGSGGSRIAGVTDEMVEAGAAAMYAKDDAYTLPWEEEAADVAAWYLSMARAVLEAVLEQSGQHPDNKDD